MQTTRAWSAASARNRRKRVLILAGLSGPSGREVPKRMNRKELTTVAGRAGGPVRSIQSGRYASGVRTRIVPVKLSGIAANW
jgi:hypothetical protein